jgi:hypothetical protein
MECKTLVYAHLHMLLFPSAAEEQVRQNRQMQTAIRGNHILEPTVTVNLKACGREQTRDIGCIGRSKMCSSEDLCFFALHVRRKERLVREMMFVVWNLKETVLWFG